MNISNITFSKLYNEDKTRIFRIKVEWEEDYFRMFILEGNSAWFALVTTRHLTKVAEQHELTFFTYMESLRDYLCNSLLSVSVGITLENEEFVIYRHVEKQNFKIKYFVVKLEKLDYQECVEELIDTLTSKCKDMCDTLLIQDREKLQIEEQKTLLERKCEELAEIKNKSDLQIYSSVALILNEKKNRIQYLTEMLEEYKNGNKPLARSKTDPKQTAQNKLKIYNSEVPKVLPSTSKREVMSDSESNHSNDYNTDDEKHEIETENAGGDNLDFLGDDFSPSPVVPKRFKTDHITCLPNLPTVDNQPSVPPCIQSAAETEPTNTESQASRFDTQDFLDMM